MKKLTPIALGFLAFTAFVGLSLMQAGAPPVVQMSEAMAATPPLGILDGIAGYNTGGDHVYNEMYINDGTGVVTTPTDGGLIAVIEDAPLTAGSTDGSGCITAAISTGLFTIAKSCGAGRVLLEACLSNVHAGNTAKTHNVVFAKNGTALTTAPQLIKIEPVDAGAQGNMGCISTTQDAVLDDTFGVYFKTGGATAEAATTRQAVIRILKVRQ
jgi:hypothetical protein